MADTHESRSRTRTADRPPEHVDDVEEAAATTTAVAVAPNRPVVGGAPLGALPLGFGAGTLGADVSGQLKAVAPTFGSVLSSIGIGVADSQTALDKGSPVDFVVSVRKGIVGESTTVTF
jgi:hypothetical protein